MKFEVMGKGTVLTSDGQDYREGQVISTLSDVQALEFKGVLKPVDDEAKSLFFDMVEPKVDGLRDHKKIQILEDRKTALNDELKRVNAQLTNLKKTDK